VSTIYYAQFKYKKNTFRVAANTDHSAHVALFKGVRAWCHNNNVKPNPVLRIVDERRYDMWIMTAGTCYLGSWPITQQEALA
jgi:hypothetical protein